MTTSVYDFTGIQTNPPACSAVAVDPHNRKHLLTKAGVVLVRKPREINTIVLHQTACVFGPRANKDARYKRALNVAAHLVTYDDGAIVFANPTLWYVYHGNASNKYSLGQEIEGHFPGLMDDSATPRREDEATISNGVATPLTVEGLEAAREGMRMLKKRAESEGCLIEFVEAHRQFSDSRRADPGQEIWRKVVMEFAVPVLGLKVRNDHVLDGGYPIPKQWDPASSAPY